MGSTFNIQIWQHAVSIEAWLIIEELSFIWWRRQKLQWIIVMKGKLTDPAFIPDACPPTPTQKVVSPTLWPFHIPVFHGSDQSGTKPGGAKTKLWVFFFSFSVLWEVRNYSSRQLCKLISWVAMNAKLINRKKEGSAINKRNVGGIHFSWHSSHFLGEIVMVKSASEPAHAHTHTPNLSMIMKSGRRITPIMLFLVCVCVFLVSGPSDSFTLAWE